LPLVPVGVDALRCTRPGRAHTYPIVVGIPDLRTDDDPGAPLAHDRAAAERLESRAGLGFAGLADSYRAELPDGEVVESRMLARGVQAIPGREEATLAAWHDLDRSLGAIGVQTVLDVGCGTGSLLLSAARRWPACVGLDRSLRRLVLVRRRLLEAGVRARLVCANVDALPFADGVFDRVVAEWILELAPNQGRALREWNRMLRPNGRLWISTPNRWSVGPDPHLGTRAGGWWPRPLLESWAKRHGMILPQRALMGARRLRRLLREAGFEQVRLAKPEIEDEARNGLFPALHRSGGTRRTIKDVPLIRQLVLRMTPTLVAAAGRTGGVRT
jgi:ubiquinone/menaquinone biosynthesis C-methylase UbiE